MQMLGILLALECQSMLLGYKPSQMCRKLQELMARAQVNLTQSHLLKQVSVHEIESCTQFVLEYSYCSSLTWVIKWHIYMHFNATLNL